MSHDLMIARDAMPIGHVSPYRRIDPAHPGRKTVITMMEVMRDGGRPADAAIYRYDFLREVFTLKDGVSCHQRGCVSVRRDVLGSSPETDDSRQRPAPFDKGLLLMPRYRYDKDLDAIVEIRDGSNFFDETKGSKGPAIIRDIDGYRAMGTDVACGGKRPFITSRSQHRAYLKRNGYVETGNETPRVYDDRPTQHQAQESRVHDIKRARGEYGSNTGADAARAFTERNRR